METKYERVRVLGKGSFGSALLVKHRASGMLYVAKEISIQAMSAQEREEARQEFRVLQQVDHPNVIRYIEHIENRGKLYIITEYANGGDMYTLLRRQSGKLLSEGEILRYFCQICLALQYLHEHYILHRDIKTMNIFLTKSGIVKLGDFGVATVLRNTMALARTVCGTPYYFSPELCRNAPYNNKSDVWALGCVLYEMCTLRNAFDGVNMKALVAKILRGAYPPIAPSYSEELKFLIASLLKRAPTERPGINRILAHRIVSNALGKFQEELTASTAPSLNKKVSNKNLTPGRFGQRGERGRRSRDDSGPVNLPAPNVPHPLIRPIFPLPDRRQDPSLLKGNIFRSPQERVKVWMENRLKQKQERAKQLKVQQPNRGNFKKDPPYLNKKPEPSTRNTSDLKAVKVNRKPSMVQQRHVKAAPQLGGPIRRLDGAAVEASLQQHVEDKQSVLELDHLLRKAVVDNRKQVERGHRELRGWKPSHLKHTHEVVNSGTPEIAMRAWEGTPIHLVPSSPVRESKQLHIGTRSNSDASNVRLSFSPGTGSLCEFDPAIACPSQPLNKEQIPIPEVSNSLADSTPKEKNWNFPYPFHHPRYGRRSLSGLSHLKEHSFDKRNIAMESRADRPLQVASSLDFDSATESAEAGKEDDISTELHKFQDNSVVVQIQNIQAHIRAIVTRTSDEINDIDFGDEATIDAGGPAGTDNGESDSEAQVEDEPSIDASERDEREIGTLQKAGILRCEEDQSSRNKKVDKVGVKRVKAPTQSGVWQDSDNSNASSVEPIQSLVKCTSDRIAVFGPHASANVTLTTTQRKQRRDLDNWLSTLFPQSPVTGVSPTVESTPSARITTKSSLYTRTEVVRQHLETLLGLETFLQAYRTLELVTRRPSTPSGAATASALVEESLQTDASASEDEEGYAEVERILGPDHVYLLPLIVQLIFCEEEENIIQKSHDPTQNT